AGGARLLRAAMTARRAQGVGSVAGVVAGRSPSAVDRAGGEPRGSRANRHRREQAWGWVHVGSGVRSSGWDRSRGLGVVVVGRRGSSRGLAWVLEPLRVGLCVG